ncbi:putative mitochondrial carrier [Podosphaera aphanis]|nr:putative mitochondrial carrier [Podosphaera aphanis]
MALHGRRPQSPLDTLPCDAAACKKNSFSAPQAGDGHAERSPVAAAAASNTRAFLPSELLASDNVSFMSPQASSGPSTAPHQCQRHLLPSDRGNSAPLGASSTRSTAPGRAQLQPRVAKSWAHFVAGGIGGMAAATLTAPLDVLKTRLQSDFYQAQLAQSRSHQARLPHTHFVHFRSGLQHFRETFQILGSVHKLEGWRALFKGLGPNLIGVVPARAINFCVVGNGKRIIADYGNDGKESAWVVLCAAALAGIVTSTATNPIWLIKTRLQLDKNIAQRSGIGATREYINSWDCIKKVVKNESIFGLYKGLSASYLGVTESTLQWVLYEQMKKSLTQRRERLVQSGVPKSLWDSTLDMVGNVGAAGGAKLIAALATYPHEVIRTRLRQAPVGSNSPKYTGLVQCFKLVWKEEGLVSLYGGLTPHLLRTVPSAAIMFGMYEGILKLLNVPA